MGLGKESNASTYMVLFALGIMALFYGLKQIYVLSSSTTIETLNDFIQIISYILLALVIINKPLRSKWLIYIVIAGTIILLGFGRSRSTGIIRLFLLLLATRGMSYRKVLKTLLWIYSSVLFLSFIFFITGVSNPSIEEGMSIGFTHPNIAALMISTIMFLWLCLKKEVDFKTMVAYLFVALLIFIFLKTRVAAVCLALFPAIHKIIQIGCKKEKKIVKWLTCYSQVIMCAISILMVMVYPMPVYNPYRSVIDYVFAYRPYLNFNNIMKYGVSLWGQNVNIYNTSEYVFNYFTGYLSDQKYNTVDNAYVLGLIITGVIPMLFTIICFILVQKKAWSNKNTLILSVGVIFALYAFIENGANEALFVFPYYYLVTVDDTRITKTYERRQLALKSGSRRRYIFDT